jgi:hypothetical protein
MTDGLAVVPERDRRGQARQLTDQATANIGRIILGKEHEVRLALTCLLARGHLEPAAHRDQLARFVLEDVVAHPSERSILFVAPGAGDRTLLDLLEPLADSKAEDCGTHVVVLGSNERRPASFSPSGPLTWLPARSVGPERSLLLYYGDGPAYALVSAAARRDETVPFFHTDDRALVAQLMLQLQRDLGMAMAE